MLMLMLKLMLMLMLMFMLMFNLFLMLMFVESIVTTNIVIVTERSTGGSLTSGLPLQMIDDV